MNYTPGACANLLVFAQLPMIVEIYFSYNNTLLFECKDTTAIYNFQIN